MNITEFTRYIDIRQKEAEAWRSLQRRELASELQRILDDDGFKRWIYKHAPLGFDNAAIHTYDSTSQKLVSVEDLI